MAWPRAVTVPYILQASMRHDKQCELKLLFASHLVSFFTYRGDIGGVAIVGQDWLVVVRSHLIEADLRVACCC